ncbi:PREDICTED: uncharacterized protein LOC109238788 [Nicotiana attenuata]|uniref:uncharacterized protein LOC109238788 n=1 Tax=Nicotiana attenuata TaxID=49451 RepID=UPI0009051F17|nr:PREDICTED: uncharacterized protein LOC109238788 [Nicotiana attenuata]
MEKGYPLKQSREGLGYKQPPPIRISIKRARCNYITAKEVSTTLNYKPSVFDRLAKPTTLVFDRLGLLKKENKRHGSNGRIGAPFSLKREILTTDYPGARPVKQVQRRFRPKLVPLIETEVNNLIEAGFVREVKYPTWISSIVPVRKKNGQIRVCVDFRDLNNACPKDEFPHPIPELMIDATTGYEAMSFMDGSSRYNQIRMSPKDEELTAFHTPKGIYCYKVMPFGLKNAGATYQRAMQNIFDDMLHKNVECYVDDLVVKSRKKDDHLQDLRMVFERLRRYQLRMNPLKCAFGVTSGKFLGFIVRHRGIEIDQDKVDAILKMPEPKDIHELKSLQVLAAPIPGKPLILYISAQERSVGALLAQGNNEGKENALYYLSRMMTPNELKYSPIEKLCLALVFSIQKLKHYFQAYVVRLVSRANPIKFVMSKPVLNDWELSDEFPDEDAMVIEIQPPWKMYFDGAAHREEAGTGIVFITSQGEVLPYSFTLTQRCSNNVVEYQALILGLEMAMDIKQLQLQVFGDSNWLREVTIQHVPRKENKRADALAALASTLSLPDQTQVAVCQRWVVPPPNDYEGEKSEVEHIASVLEVEIEDWRQPLIDYLCYGILPENPLRKMEIRRRAPRFLYYKNTLYRRSFDGVLLRYLGTDESLQALQEEHSGVCGAHQSGPKLHFHIKRTGDWPTMVKDCLDYAWRCKACQFHANFIHQPPEVLHPTVASWPFDAWGLDVVGPLPKSSGGHLYILANFIRVNIIYRFGIPRYILTHNGKPFDNKLMNKICDLFGFKQRNSSMYYAAANGLAEAFNKTLCNLLKKVVSKSKRDWHERMEEALWRQIQSLRLAIQEGLTDEENARLRLEELEALDEKRLEAQQSLECYQARLSRSFNKRVRLRSFQVGDQVLVVKRPIITSRRSGGKFSAKWDGPYIVQEVYSSGAYKIVDSEGLRIGPINGKFMKRYYP